MKEIEELMKPRFKVIADYPGCLFPVDTVFHLDKFYAYGKLNGIVSLESNYGFQSPDKYPAVFRLLQWWEERSIEDMPEYIRLNQITVCKVAKHFTSVHGRVGFMDRATKYDYPYDVCLPATLEEYQSYQSIKSLK